MANGPQIVPAPRQSQQRSGLRIYPQAPTPYEPHPLAYVGSIGPKIVQMRQQKDERTQNRQAQIMQLGLQMIAQDSSIDLSKFLPAETTLDTWNSLSAAQQSRQKQQKDAERQGQVQPEVNRLPGLVAGGQTGPAREILGQLGPEELAGASRQLALQLPGARMANTGHGQAGRVQGTTGRHEGH